MLYKVYRWELDSFLVSLTLTLTDKEVSSLIIKATKKTCSLDPMPTTLVVECLDVLLPVLTKMINLSLQSGCFADRWKHADVHPKLKSSFLIFVP